MANPPPSGPVLVGLVRMLGLDRHEVTHADYNVGLGYLAEIGRSAGAIVEIHDPLDPQGPGPNPLLTTRLSIVGFTMHHLNVAETLDCVRRVKTKNPDTFVVLGGHHATATADELLRDVPEIDAVCCGDGEDQFDRLVRATIHDHTKAKTDFRGKLTPKRYWDLEALPFPSLPDDMTIGRISTSRGCPYECSFCTTPALRHLLDEPPYRSRSPESVVNELSALVEKGVRRVRINDDMYVMGSTRSQERALRIARLIAERGLELRYKAEYRVDSFRPHQRAMVEALRDSGLREVFLGIESGSDRILAEYNKRLATRQSIEMLALYDALGIVVNAGNILASPDSTIQDVCASVDGFWRMGLAYLLFRRVNFRAHVFPGTALEASLRVTGRLIGSSRYMPLSYHFIDRRLEDVCDWFERSMPAFLRNGGGTFFEVRREALEAVYEGRADRAHVNALLEELNNTSRNILHRWFTDLPVASLAEPVLREEMEVLAARFAESAKSLQALSHNRASR